MTPFSLTRTGHLHSRQSSACWNILAAKPNVFLHKSCVYATPAIRCKLS